MESTAGMEKICFAQYWSRPVGLLSPEVDNSYIIRVELYSHVTNESYGGPGEVEQSHSGIDSRLHVLLSRSHLVRDTWGRSVHQGDDQDIGAALVFHISGRGSWQESSCYSEGPQLGKGSEGRDERGSSRVRDGRRSAVPRTDNVRFEAALAEHTTEIGRKRPTADVQQRRTVFPVSR